MLGCSDRYYLDSLDQKVDNLMDIMRVCMCKKILSFGWILIWAWFRDMPFGFFNMAVAHCGRFFAGVEHPVTPIWTRNSMPSSSSEFMALDPWAMVGRGNHPKHDLNMTHISRFDRITNAQIRYAVSLRHIFIFLMTSSRFTCAFLANYKLSRLAAWFPVYLVW